MKIVVAGIMGRYPYGGVSWCSLMYLLGLRRLGHDVCYVEDTGECNFDPEANALATDPAYALRNIGRTLAPYGLDDRWCYIDYTGGFHGMTEDDWRRRCSDADLFLNLSGGSWFWRDEYAAIPNTAFIDSDPAFTQLAIADGPDWYVDFFRRFDTLFTFGANIGTDSERGRDQRDGLAPHLAAGHARRVGADRRVRPADEAHHDHDVGVRELSRHRRQQEPRVRSDRRSSS